jgi:hypothetical protein
VSLPDWKTSAAGTKVRVALWLQAEVGEGGHFTKADLRAAFPQVEQVDRRMRDLRAEGWVLATAREDPTLKQDEIGLRKIGGKVWEPGYRSSAASGLSAKERKAVLARDGYACTICGVVAGETYPDDPIRTGTLGVVGKGDGAMTVCERCRVGGAQPEDPASIIEGIRQLKAGDREALAQWVREGSRPQGVAETLWARYRRLPPDTREEIRRNLDGV